MESDAELLHRYARDRSEVAFTELVRRHLDLVYSAALRQTSGDAHRARDISQLVFIDLARNAGKVASHPSLRGWLFTATHFAASKYVRTERRRQVREQEAHAMQEITANPDASIDWDQIRPVLDDAMHQLPERDRHAVLMRYFDQKPTTEIGAALGLSESAARRLTDRALDELRALLARRGITSTAAALGTVLSTQTVTAAPAGFASSLCSSAISGTASPSTPLTFILSSANKVQLVILAASVVLNLALFAATGFPQSSLVEAQIEQLTPAVVKTFVPPATPIVGDFNDPVFLARKLYAEGYSEKGIRSAVLESLHEPFRATLDARRRLYAAALDRQPRWQTSSPKVDPVELNATGPVPNERIYEEADRIVDAVLREAVSR